MKRLGDTSTLSASETTIASAATTDLGTSKNRNVLITGTTTITGFGSATQREYLIRFAGALTLTYNATSLILPGAANIVTAAGDTCWATSDPSGNWRVRGYQRAAQTPAIVPQGAFRTDYTPTVTASSGTLTSASALCSYQVTGKRVDIVFKVTITTNGSGSGAVLVSLPLQVSGRIGGCLAGRSNVTGRTLAGYLDPSATATGIVQYDNTYPGSDGAVLILNGWYEAA